MPSLVIPNTFTAGTDAIASEVNANFDAIVTLLNTTKLDAANLQDAAVTEAKIADNAVKHTKIGTVPTVRVARTTNQSITINTNTNLSFNSETWDTDAMFAPTSDTLTCKTAGKYRVWCSVRTDGDDIGNVTLVLVKNGTGVVADGALNLSTSVDKGVSVYGEIDLAVNDTLTFVVFHDSSTDNTVVLLANTIAAGATWFGD